ncbi:hypothetical protein B0A48_10452 [Cryoendolithus antarcticus]|uniref:Peptidase S54 rhomboid domain-containing protein n=1 Tax=Cryoendolithus antarcticus TaxID=1507870 RepID=A0A1V8SXP9_9PEZI|nr:hypothetical protein B0A48_10452 [Cryoendolithus antarcticus]
MSSTPFFSQSSLLDRANGQILSTLGRSYSGGPSYYSYRSVRAVIWILIGLNVPIFAMWQQAKATNDRRADQLLRKYCTLSWDGIKQGRYYTTLTSAFAHQDWLHFGFNMFALNTFGSVLAMAGGVSPAKVIGLALGSALASSAAFLWHSKPIERDHSRRGWLVATKREPIRAGLGASGLVSGLAGATTLLMPSLRMQIFPIPVAIPLWGVTCIYAAVDAYFLNDSNSNVGHAAHLGGLAFGAVFYLFELRKLGGVWQVARRLVLRR